MSKFKTGDKIECVEKGHRITAGKFYEVISSGSEFTNVINDNGNAEGYWHHRFKLVKEELKPNNPCIHEEVITTTKRKIKSAGLGYGIYLNPSRDGRTDVVTIHTSAEYQYTSAKDLRSLAKQLIEIADVLDEGE